MTSNEYTSTSISKTRVLATCLLLGSTVLLADADQAPDDLRMTRFAAHDLTPSPACLCASATGDVYVGVDLRGSLGKGTGGGRIVRLSDTNQDGVADAHTVFALIDNPRGLISRGNKLYVLHTAFNAENRATGMNLVVLEDADRDGIADGPAKCLVENICSASAINSRGTDHSTNGIQLGIDGWIYIAIGDFGFYKATGRDGTQLTLLGGGIVRVRPDGTELEQYTTGTRNIYDIAIDPLMNIFTRGNTNDGGGWNIRFLHHIQSGEYGYPRLFVNFAEEIIPALQDLGGGSGTGALFLSEPGWPAHYNNQPLMSDWGRNEIFLHRIRTDGPTFLQQEERFVTLLQPTDLDVDPSGQMFISAWDDAGFGGNPSKGYVVRVVPNDWIPQPYVNFQTLTPGALVNALRSTSATTRLYAQDEILRQKNPAKRVKAIQKIVRDNSAPLPQRVAALFTLAQIETNPHAILKFADDDALREFALRAATDRRPRLANADLPLAPFVSALASGTPREKVAAATALGRLGKIEASAALLAVPFSMKAPNDAQGNIHATPNPDIVLPHIAVQSLVHLNAVQPCLDALGTPAEDLALWALSRLHSEETVSGLIEALKTTEDLTPRRKRLTTLARLYHQEAPYDASWWWGTRPDTRGPYYKPVGWSATPRIADVLLSQIDSSNADTVAFLTSLNKRYRLGLSQLETQHAPKPVAERPSVDLKEIANQEGDVGKAALEDIVIAVNAHEGDLERGERLFTQQGCVACHTLQQGDAALGPFMGQIGAIMTKEQIAIAILRPNESISQGFQTSQITLKDGSTVIGFVTARSNDTLILRDMLSKETTLAANDIAEEKHLPMSMMPEGLANALSLKDFAALVSFLAHQK